MNTSTDFSEAQQAERAELFRYADMSHPLIQLLYQFQLPATPAEDDI